MQQRLSFIRLVFLGLCLLLASSYVIGEAPSELLLVNLGIGIIVGFGIWTLMIVMDLMVRRFNLRALNTATIGLLCGYLMGGAIMLLFETVLEALKNEYTPEALTATRLIVYLLSTYLAMVVAARSSNEINASIPFINFKQASQKRKDLLLDTAALSDPRIIDLSQSGLLDNALILPRFIVKECTEQVENSDETIRTKAKRCLENIKKLETIQGLEIRSADADFNDIKDQTAKLINLARLLDAYILTADTARHPGSVIDGVRFINLHMLSTSLKPLVANGEFLNIKIQRYGKEPRQGVGYLDDGTMVVVNGGAEFIGETIKAQVLSAKHTSSGRMIFCNALEDTNFQDFQLGNPSLTLSSPLQSSYASANLGHAPLGHASLGHASPTHSPTSHADVPLSDNAAKNYFAH